MRFEIDGRPYDTAELLDMHIGPIPRWLGGEIDLVAVYADPEGRLYVQQDSRHVEETTGRPVGTLWTRANRDVVRYLTERFELPPAYLAASREG